MMYVRNGAGMMSEIVVVRGKCYAKQGRTD